MSTYITKRAAELGLKKQDARTPMRLMVTARDVTKGRAKDPHACAFARACRRTDDVTAAYIFRSTAWVEYPDKLVRYLLPPSMQKEVVAFDRGKAMEPGEYQLVPPSKSLRMSEIKRRHKNPQRYTRRGASGIKRKIVHRTTGVRTLAQFA